MFDVVGIDYHGLSAVAFMNAGMFSYGSPLLAGVSGIACTVLVCSSLHKGVTHLECYIKSRLEE